MSTGFFGSTPAGDAGNTQAPTSFFKDGAAYENITAPQDILNQIIARVGDPPFYASTIVNVPAGNISSTNVQDAINELDGSIRVRCTSNLTLYVATAPNGGSDSNTGLAGSPLLTIAKAFDLLFTQYDGNGFTATVSVGSGSFAGAQIVNPPFGFSSVTLTGAGVALTTITSTIQINNFRLLVSNFKITSSGGGFLATTRSELTIAGAIEFGACTSRHIRVTNVSLLSFANTPTITITGGSVYFISMAQNGVMSNNACNVTLTGAPAYSGAFIDMSVCSTADFGGMTITGAASGAGKEYNIQSNAAAINTGGGAKFSVLTLAAGTTDGYGIIS